MSEAYLGLLGGYTDVRFISIAVAAFAILALGACATRDALGTGAAMVPDAAARRLRAGAPTVRNAAQGKILHVVYIIQENRSFNNLFMGFKGATTQSYGYDMNNNKIELQPEGLEASWDINHFVQAFFAADDNGKNDGWNNEGATPGAPANYAYSYVPKKETTTYWQLAEQYVLADNLFQSNLDGSFVAHQYAIAAYANHEVNYPPSWYCAVGSNPLPTLNADRSFGPNVNACEDYTTLGDELDAASLTWRIYTYPYNVENSGGIWNGYAAINHIFNGPDWATDVITPATNFTSDVAGGTLASVTWITPNVANSDHSGFGSKTGPAWVASLVNAVGQSQFWDSTAIFIAWDDWGGWFDPVLPIYVDYDGLGYRVPLIAVSAYAKKGYVSHVQYEASSVLTFTESTFGLAPLAASDARAANPVGDFFDFTAKPRKFKAFKSAKAAGDAPWRGAAPQSEGD
jgi:phospholipase C